VDFAVVSRKNVVNIVIDKKLLFDRKTIKSPKDHVKEKNRPKARLPRGSFKQNGNRQGGTF
jgi:hypothetical protein